jgi:large subunit ribosomal protein L25
MKTVSLSGLSREGVGKKDAATLRAEGRVPAVLYGGDKQIHFSLNMIEFSKYVYSPDVYKFELEIDGKKYEAIMKELQFHPVSDRMVHADFLQLMPGKAVKLELPLRISGSSIGVRGGGKLVVNFRRIMVKGIPDNLPDVFQLDITKLRIGQTLRIKDIKSEGIDILHAPDAVVVSVRRARGAVDTPEEEESSEAEEGAEAAAEPAAEA